MSTRSTSAAQSGAVERILVVGAGSGGTMVANKLDRSLGGLASVTVVDRSPIHRYQPAYYLDPFGYAAIESTSRETRDLLRSDIRFHQATVERFDPAEQAVVTSEATLHYDRLVVALGHRTAPDRQPGLAEGWAQTPERDAVYPFYEPEPAQELGDALDELTGADRLVVTVPETPVSCSGAPLKFALLAEDALPPETTVTVLQPGTQLFGDGPKEPYDEALQEVWDDRDVEVREGFTVDHVAPEDDRVHATDGRSVEYDLYAPVPPQAPPQALAESTLVGPAGYLEVDSETLRHRHDDRVYGIGDCTDLPTSKTAAAARKQAHVLTENIVADTTSVVDEAHYDGTTACPLLTRKGHAILAMFDYEKPVAPAVESRLAWLVDIHLIPRLYWLWMRGYDPVPL